GPCRSRTCRGFARRQVLCQTLPPCRAPPSCQQRPCAARDASCKCGRAISLWLLLDRRLLLSRAAAPKQRGRREPILARSCRATLVFRFTRRSCLGLNETVPTAQQNSAHSRESGNPEPSAGSPLSRGRAEQSSDRIITPP